MEFTEREERVLEALRKAGAVDLGDDAPESFDAYDKHQYVPYRALDLPAGYGPTLASLERKGVVRGYYPGIQQTSGEKVWSIS